MNLRLLPLVLVPVGLCCASVAAAAPRWLRLSYTGSPDTTVSIRWNDDAAADGTVEYRPLGGDVSQAAATATATGIGDFGTMLAAELTGLQPASSYEYRVSSSGGWSDWHGFQTAPTAGTCTPFHFVASGDSRGFELPPKTGAYFSMQQWADIATALAGEQGVFALHVGDLLYTGNNAPPDQGTRTDEWATELGKLEPLSSVSPFFMAIGNHDVGPNGTQGDGAYFNLLFDDPADGPQGTDDNFSFVAGNVLVVGLSTYTFAIDDDIAWLETVLAATQSQVDWRVIFFHTPVWSSGLHGSDEYDLLHAAQFVALLDQYGVELVLNGHDHDYERFHPSKGGYGAVPQTVTPLAQDNGHRGTPDGTVYYVTGGGGAQLVGAIAFPNVLAGSAFRSTRLEYLRLDVHAGSMTITTRDCGNASLLPTSHATCAGDLETVVLEKPVVVCSGGEGGGGAGGAGGAGAGGAGAGGSGTGGTIHTGGTSHGGGSGPGPSAQPGASTEDSGCGCRLAGAGGRATPLGLPVLVALGMRLRRRRLSRRGVR